MRRPELLNYFRGREQQQNAQPENADRSMQFVFPTGYDIAVIADPVWHAALMRIQLANSDIRSMQDVARLKEVAIKPDKEEHEEQQADKPDIPFDAQEVIANYKRSHPRADFVGDHVFVPHKQVDGSLSPAEELASKPDKTTHIVREFCYRIDIDQLSETVIAVEDGLLSELATRVLNPKQKESFPASSEPQPVYIYSPGAQTVDLMSSQPHPAREV